MKTADYLLTTALSFSALAATAQKPAEKPAAKPEVAITELRGSNWGGQYWAISAEKDTLLLDLGGTSGGFKQRTDQAQLHQTKGTDALRIETAQKTFVLTGIELGKPDKSAAHYTGTVIVKDIHKLQRAMPHFNYSRDVAKHKPVKTLRFPAGMKKS